jgi:phage gp36-like protein
MSYCTYDDVETRLGPDDLAALADHDGDGAADAQVVEQAIESASALIDSYLGVRFSVPVLDAEGSPPESLRTAAVNLAVYLLQLGRDSVTEDVRLQHEEDVAWLTDVARGRVSPGVEPRPDESAGAPGVRHRSQPRLFGRDAPL